MRLSRAFTMIELVFVIVILGILAAVAIPKLMATRDDAKISKMAMDIMTGASEISAYAMSQGKTEDNLSKMSNTISSLENEGVASISTTDKKATLKFNTVNDCVILQVNTNATDENLSLSYANAGSDKLCKGLQKAIDSTKYSMKLRGGYVKY